MGHEIANLKTMLAETGLSQEQFGKIFDKSLFQINNYVTGRTAIPRELILRISKMIEVSPEDFKTKDLTKQIKKMVVVIPTELPDSSAKDRETIDRLLAELAAAKDRIIELQAQLLQQK